MRFGPCQETLAWTFEVSLACLTTRGHARVEHDHASLRGLTQGAAHRRLELFVQEDPLVAGRPAVHEPALSRPAPQRPRGHASQHSGLAHRNEVVHQHHYTYTRSMIMNGQEPGELLCTRRPARDGLARPPGSCRAASASGWRCRTQPPELAPVATRPMPAHHTDRTLAGASLPQPTGDRQRRPP